MITEHHSPTRMCRVLVHTDGGGADLALPVGLPVAALLPVLHDVLADLGLPLPDRPTLIQPGRGSLDEQKTLHQNGIGDGAMLLLTDAGVPVGRPVVIDIAAGVAGTATGPRSARPAIVRRAGAMMATALAAVTGYLVVPGGPGLPEVVLAGAAATVTALLASRAVDDPDGGLAALSCAGALCTAAAVAGTVAGLGVAGAGSVLCVVALAMLTSGNRIAVRSCGLSMMPPGVDREDLERRTAAARRTAGVLTTGAAGGAALGVVAVFGGAPALGAVVAGILLLRARADQEMLPAAALLTCGTLCAALSLAALPPVLAPVPGAVALTVLACAGRVPLTLTVARVLGVVELALLAAVPPLVGWQLGAFAPLAAALPW